MLDDELLNAFVNCFYGYGDFHAPYWFVGMEEGGGETPEDIASRLQTWHFRGQRELEDVAEYHAAIGINKYFDTRGVLQTTWNKLIRVLLTAEGTEPSTELVREYQKYKLGRPGGKSCLTELLPLPSPGVDRWLHYAQLSRLPFLATRQAYTEHIQPKRVARLRHKIAEHKPRAVVFYGMQYLPSWETIAGISLNVMSTPGVRSGVVDGTTFLAIRHPAATGVTNAYYHAIGAMIRVGSGAA